MLVGWYASWKYRFNLELDPPFQRIGVVSQAFLYFLPVSRSHIASMMGNIDINDEQWREK